MNIRRHLPTLLSLVLGLNIVSGNAQTPEKATPEPASEVDSALASYRAAVLEMKSAQIAALFTEQATIAHGEQTPIAGRENIRRFLDSFAGYKVLSYDLKADATAVQDNQATQSGSYAQTVTNPENKTLQVQGTFRARWARQENGAWLIEEMRTQSKPSG